MTIVKKRHLFCTEYEALHSTCEHPGLSSAVIPSTDHNHPQGSLSGADGRQIACKGGKIKGFYRIFINYLG